MTDQVERLDGAMTDAYVNIIVDAGAVSAAASEIADIEAVDTLHVTLDDHEDLPSIVADQIHPVTGVVDTVTNVAFEP